MSARRARVTNNGPETGALSVERVDSYEKLMSFYDSLPPGLRVVVRNSPIPIDIEPEVVEYVTPDRVKIDLNEIARAETRTIWGSDHPDSDRDYFDGDLDEAARASRRVRRSSRRLRPEVEGRGGRGPSRGGAGTSTPEPDEAGPDVPVRR